MALHSLEDLLEEQIKDLYDAEHQITQTLPKVIKAVSSPELKEALEKHLIETQNHVRRLDNVCKHLEISPKGKKCKAMKGILEEGGEVLKEDGTPSVLDAALIAACQRVEHYEIASYGSAIAFASQLDEEIVVGLLQETLDEEKAADETLTDIAEEYVNSDAGAVDEEDAVLNR